jgi:hypothetical protein
VTAVAEMSCGYRVHPLLRDWLDTTAPPLVGQPVLLAGGVGDAAALITAGAAVQRWPRPDGGPRGRFPLVAVVDYLESLVGSKRREAARRLANAVAPRGILLLIKTPPEQPQTSRTMPSLTCYARAGSSWTPTRTWTPLRS